MYKRQIEARRAEVLSLTGDNIAFIDSVIANSSKVLGYVLHTDTRFVSDRGIEQTRAVIDRNLARYLIETGSIAYAKLVVDKNDNFRISVGNEANTIKLNSKDNMYMIEYNIIGSNGNVVGLGIYTHSDKHIAMSNCEVSRIVNLGLVVGSLCGIDKTGYRVYYDNSVANVRSGYERVFTLDR